MSCKNMNQSHNGNYGNFILNKEQMQNIDLNEELSLNSAPFLSICNLNDIFNNGNVNNITESQIHYHSENIYQTLKALSVLLLKAILF